MSNENPDFSNRVAESGVSELFVQRWSPRAYLQQPVTDDELRRIFDAARWSPSCYNDQPWLFLTSTPTSREKFLNLLVEANQAWAKTAPVIGFVVAAKNFGHNGKPNALASFDSGAAWMAVNLQASLLGLHAHGMAGINYQEVYKQLDIDPATHQVICGFVLGKLDTSADEVISSRKPLADIWQPCN